MGSPSQLNTPKRIPCAADKVQAPHLRLYQAHHRSAPLLPDQRRSACRDHKHLSNILPECYDRVAQNRRLYELCP